MLNRRIRKVAMFTLSIAALLLAPVLTAASASAAMPPCSAGCFFRNLYSSGSNHGLFAEPQGHDQAILSSWTIGGIFSFTGKSGSWGIIQDDDGGAVQGECWNTNGSVIGLDSCPSGDTNEYFEFVIHGNYWLIKSYRTGLYVAADRDHGQLYFTNQVNDTSLWQIPA